GFVAAMLDPNLNAAWANGFGTPQQDFPASIALASNDDVILSGNSALAAGATFTDSKGTVSFGLAQGGAGLLFRLSAASGSALWARPIPHAGNGAPNQLIFNGAAIDSKGRVVAGGVVYGTVAVGTKSAVSVADADGFIATFDGTLGTPLD